jgi:hypothetical protein
MGPLSVTDNVKFKILPQQNPFVRCAG